MRGFDKPIYTYDRKEVKRDPKEETYLTKVILEHKKYIYNIFYT
jgi:hypothetical protein